MEDPVRPDSRTQLPSLRRPLGALRERLENKVARAWQRRGPLAWALWPLSWLFIGIAAARRAAFAAGWRAAPPLGVPVIVVGNVTVGGTGKTPTVIALVKALQANGFTPGVVSRGFGARLLKPAPVTPDARAAEVGDEPLLIARNSGVPVFVCPDRVAAAQALRAAHPEVDVLVSDDGLQHYRLARTIEIVVFDDRLGGNGFRLPAGPLREAMGRRRDATLVNDPYSPVLPPWPDTFRLTLESGAAWQLVDPRNRRALAEFRGQRILAAAGIGAPERFFAGLRAAGLAPATRALPDHYAFDENPFLDPSPEPRIASQLSPTPDAILITEKDAVKCVDWQDARLWAVPVSATLDPHLIDLVVEKLRGRPIA